MIKLKSLKSKIIAGMVGLSLVTAVAIGTISVIKSSQIISNNAKEMLLISSKNKSSEIYNDLKQVEKNVILMGSLVSSASSIESKSDLEKIRNIGNAEKEYSKIRNYAKKLGENTKWCMSTYFYFDQNYISSYDGAWYVEKNGNFTRKILNTPITKEDGGYYWTPIETGKGMWAAPYVDSDLKLSMITYSTPVYKNGLLLGLAGMDITLDNLNRSVKNIKVYKNTEAFIVDNNFNFVAGKEFKVGDNILTAKNGMYKFLENPLRKQKSGYIEYKSKGISKILTYSTLPNGFILLINVPVSEVLSEMNNMICWLIFIALAAIALASIIAVKIGRRISKPIENLAQISLKLADNDLTVNIDEDNSSQEMTYLSTSFKNFVKNLSHLIGQILDSAVNVSSNTDELNAASEQTALGAQQVAKSITQLAEGAQQIAKGVMLLADGAEDQSKLITNSLRNINKINQTIQVISQGAENAIQISQASENDAMSGKNQATNAVEKVNQLKVSAKEISGTINELGQLSSDIGIIVELIKKIAGQTNLLALNAAIEAARAGSQGKGFTVVAEEVKKLADQSADATDKITAMIKEIQNKTKFAVTSMDKNVQEVENGVIIIKDVGQSLDQILAAAQETTLHVQKISGEVKNLAQNSDEVVKMVENIASISEQAAESANQISYITEQSASSAVEISSVTQEQTASLEEISASSHSLAQTAEDLKKLVAVFKL